MIFGRFCTKKCTKLVAFRRDFFFSYKKDGGSISRSPPPSRRWNPHFVHLTHQTFQSGHGSQQSDSKGVVLTRNAFGCRLKVTRVGFRSSSLEILADDIPFLALPVWIEHESYCSLSASLTYFGGCTGSPSSGSVGVGVRVWSRVAGTSPNFSFPLSGRCRSGTDDFLWADVLRTWSAVHHPAASHPVSTVDGGFACYVRFFVVIRMQRFFVRWLVVFSEAR